MIHQEVLPEKSAPTRGTGAAWREPFKEEVEVLVAGEKVRGARALVQQRMLTATGGTARPPTACPAVTIPN